MNHHANPAAPTITNTCSVWSRESVEGGVDVVTGGGMVVRVVGGAVIDVGGISTVGTVVVVAG